MAKNWLSRLSNLSGFVTGDYDPTAFENSIQSPSPSINWAFGTKGHGLPLGYSLLMGGQAKAGKTFIAMNIAAEVLKGDPEAYVVMFNTEFRGEAQAGNAKTKEMLGLDDRFIVYDTNNPEEIFDRIEKDFNEMCQEGFKLKLIIIDSTSMINGRRTMNADSVMQQQIGDKAATIQAGLERILPVVRRNRIAMIQCAHIRDEMDQAEQMRGNKYKLQAANAQKHLNEFFVMVERNRTKDGRQDLMGKEFKNEEITDSMGKSDMTGHKIRFKMMDSSLGKGSGRTGEFTLDFERGIINQHEEVFNLGLNTGVITNAGAMYSYGDKQYRGKGALLEAIKNDKELYNTILTAVYKKDE